MADAVEKTPIPAIPPQSAKASKDAERGIAAIIAACEAGGLTSKYAKCALLGAIGEESKWVPVEESHKYSYKVLSTKPRVSDEDAIKYSYDKGQGVTKLEFFGWYYGTRNGKPPAVGNYYGRGFVQLTWKENYEALGKLTGYDLANNPDLMVGTSTSTMEVCAKVAVEFIKMRIKTWNQDQWNPGFVFKVLHAINPGDPKGSKSYDNKISYYEYFLGAKAVDAPTDKNAASSSVNKTQAEIDAAPASKRQAYTEDRSVNFDKVGFTDPEGKYPLRDYMNEPDTNRLARGIIDGTNINFKDSVRKKNIPTANGGYYDQPEAAYSSVYPYNKVMETESGHIMEFDDSPDGERINIFHRKGTYQEIDPNGTQTNYIVGDNFTIVERNNNVYIIGTCNVTCSGPMNILCQGDANLEVKGQADCTFHNDVNMGVALDFNLAVGGDYNVKVEGNHNVEVGKTTNVRSIGTLSLESTDSLKLKTGSGMALESGDSKIAAEILMKLSSNVKIETSENYQIKAKNVTIDASDIVTINGATKVDLNPNGFVPLDSLGTSKVPVDFAGKPKKDYEAENVLIDTVLTPAGEYNPNTLPQDVITSSLNKTPLTIDQLIKFGGKSPDVYDLQYSGPIESKTNLAAAKSNSSNRLVVPPVEAAYNQPFNNLVPPARHTDGVYKYETEEDWNSVQGQKTRKTMLSTSDYEHNGGIPGAPEESAKATGGINTKISIPQEKLNEINGMSDFPSSYKLSEHFTLGMLVHQQGHSLQDTVLPDGPYTKQKIVANLCALAQNILEPIYAELGTCKQQGSGKWQITSGLRNEKSGSDHNKGCAVDIQLISRNIHEQFDLCVKLEKILPYHKILFEYRNKGTSNWIHISFVSEGRMGLCSTMIDDKIVDSSGNVTHGSTGIHKFYV